MSNDRHNKKPPAGSPETGIFPGKPVYVRSVEVSGRPLWAVFSDEGEHLGLATSRAVAFAAAVQNDLQPQSVH